MRNATTLCATAAASSANNTHESILVRVRSCFTTVVTLTHCNSIDVMHMTTRLVEHLLADTARALDGVFDEIVVKYSRNGSATSCPAHTGVDRINARLAEWESAAHVQVTYNTEGRRGEWCELVLMFDRWLLLFICFLQLDTMPPSMHIMHGHSWKRRALCSTGTN